MGQELELAAVEKVPAAQTAQSAAFIVFEEVPGVQSAQLASAVDVQAVTTRVPG
jgi:hypothetical protein